MMDGQNDGNTKDRQPKYNVAPHFFQNGALKTHIFYLQ